MRHFKSKLTFLAVTSLVLILLLQISVLATNERLAILNETEDKYIIYIDGVSKQEFEFAFSDNKTSEKTSLDYIKSIKDNTSTETTEVAYIDKELLQKFADKDNIYIWARTGENYIVEAEKIDLKNSIEKSNMQMVDSITKRIKVDTTATETREETINNVKTTITTGKVDILDNQSNTYYYQLVKLPNTEEYNNFMDLAEKISKFNSNTSIFEKLVTSKEFYNLYNKLIPDTNDKNWLKVNNMEIKQPEESKQDEKYVLWLKMVDPKGEEITDAQFLTCYEDYKPEYIKEDVVVKTTNKLPITYDSIALVVIFAILLLFIAIVYILKKKEEKNNKGI